MTNGSTSRSICPNLPDDRLISPLKIVPTIGKMSGLTGRMSLFVASKIHEISILHKDDILSAFSMKQCIVIGDGINDYPLFKYSDIAILYGGVNDVSKQLINVVDYFSKDSKIICRLLKQLL